MACNGENRKLRGSRDFLRLLCHQHVALATSGAGSAKDKNGSEMVGNNCCGLCDTKMNNSPCGGSSNFQQGIRGIGVHCFGRMNDYHAPAALVRRHANKVSQGTHLIDGNLLAGFLPDSVSSPSRLNTSGCSKRKSGCESCPNQ